MERAIGTRITLEVVESEGGTCKDCFLRDSNCDDFNCSGYNRADGKNINYKIIKEEYIMTKEEFKKRWESDKNGGGITFDECAQCAKEWGIIQNPYRYSINDIVSRVCQAAGVKEE